jgi:hypothetical protein
LRTKDKPFVTRFVDIGGKTGGHGVSKVVLILEFTINHRL